MTRKNGLRFERKIYYAAYFCLFIGSLISLAILGLFASEERKVLTSAVYRKPPIEIKTSVITPTTLPSPVMVYSISPTPRLKAPVAYQAPKVAQQAAADIEDMFTKYGNNYGVNREYLKKIAHCESTYNPGAVNGIYGGMYQFSASTWIATRNSMGLDPNPDLRFNAEEAVRTTAFKIAHGGSGAWPVCGRS